MITSWAPSSRLPIPRSAEIRLGIRISLAVDVSTHRPPSGARQHRPAQQSERVAPVDAVYSDMVAPRFISLRDALRAACGLQHSVGTLAGCLGACQSHGARSDEIRPLSAILFTLGFVVEGRRYVWIVTVTRAGRTICPRPR